VDQIEDDDGEGPTSDIEADEDKIVGDDDEDREDGNKGEDMVTRRIPTSWKI
jgi:hypothetical protein